jgi:hypothetical protein
MTDKYEMIDFLIEKCLEDEDLLESVIEDYVTTMSDSKFEELEDLMVNNFGDD